ncbi:MAG: PIN domain-containing protein [Candidatus Micrarchaeota archaeon]|nr:PIN domain-containing protein [Candidatus Micrarchaeota archaeon]
MEYLEGRTMGQEVRRRIKNAELFTSAVTVTEVVSKVHKTGGDVDTAYSAITSMSQIATVNEAFAKKVGLLHGSIKRSRPNFSFGDAFTLQTAMDLHAKVLTGDQDFKGMRDAELLK